MKQSTKRVIKTAVIVTAAFAATIAIWWFGTDVPSPSEADETSQDSVLGNMLQGRANSVF